MDPWKGMPSHQDVDSLWKWHVRAARGLNKFSIQHNTSRVLRFSWRSHSRCPGGARHECSEGVGVRAHNSYYNQFGFWETPGAWGELSPASGYVGLLAVVTACVVVGVGQWAGVNNLKHW